MSRDANDREVAGRRASRNTAERVFPPRGSAQKTLGTCLRLGPRRFKTPPQRLTW